jgi:gliding motility-associated lipoprotein GldD
MRIKLKKLLYTSLFFVFFSAFLSCGTDSDDIIIPKPRAYFRIDFPDKKYKLFSDSCPFEFEYPDYALVVPDDDPKAEPCWKNIVYPSFKAEINFTYKKIEKNKPLEGYLDDSWLLAIKHQMKASGMPETVIRRDTARVYGLLFEMEGNTASNFQFYLTDSTQHFIRGALYFYARPNYDSLAPVIQFLKKDAEQMISTFRWKTNNAPRGNTK